MERKKVRLGLFLLAVLLCIWAMHRVTEEALKRWEARGKESVAGCFQAMLLRSAEETMAPSLSLRSIEPMEWLEEDLLSFLAPVITMDLDGLFSDVRHDEPHGKTPAEGETDALSDQPSQKNPMMEVDRENATYAAFGGKEENATFPKGENLGDGANGIEDKENMLDQIMSEQNGLDPTELGQSTSGQGDLGKAEIDQEELGQMELDKGEAIQTELYQTMLLPEKVRALSAESMNTYAELVKNFYVIDSTTMADASLLDAERFLAKDMRIDKTTEGPQILIYHTHSKEAFADSEPGNARQTVVGVGDELTRILTERYGYQVLHHTGTYDLPSRNGAYSRALPEVERILSVNPSIQVVIDLHRDEMPKNVHLITEIDGKQTARFMFFNGISRTRKTGELEYLANPYLEENLALSFQLEKAAQEYYPNLTRKIYLKGYRYNMHICPKTLLIELGAQNNTFEEAINACEPLASLLDLVLSGRERVADP